MTNDLKANSDKNLVLIDGSAYLFRAFHAMPPLTNDDDFPTGAMYGVINMLKKLKIDCPAKYYAVVFDAKGKNFRHELSADYKAHRVAMPEELQRQIEPLFAIIKALGYKLIQIDGVEADDVIGTLAAMGTAQNLKVTIASGDKDFAQLVNDNVYLFNPMNNEQLDVAGIENKFKVRPDQIIDYLSLVGDTADNIKGVDKVGPKTACKWLQVYGNIDNLIAHQDELSGKVADNLKSSHANLYLAQKLVRLNCAMDLDFVIEDLVPGPVDVLACKDLYQKYGFKGWLQALNHGEQNSTTSDSNLVDHQKYRMLTDKAEFLAYLKTLKAAKIFAFDSETTGLNCLTAKIVGLSFATQPGQGVYIPLMHDYLGAPAQLPIDFVLAELKPILEDKSLIKVAHHLKFDMHILANHGISVQGVQFDTLLESYVLNNNQVRHNMDALAKHYLNLQTQSFESVAGKGAKQKTFNQITLDIAGPYAAEDADITLCLHQNMWPKLLATKTLSFVYENIELPLVAVLVKMERHGVLVDLKLLALHSQELAKRLSELEHEAHALAGEVFNLNSPKQLKEILFEKLGLPVLDKTPAGQASTAEASLLKLAEQYPLPKLITLYRSLAKLKSTYTDSLPEQINAQTGRIHTSYQQAVTSTGRLSSTEPNLQNIPVKTDEGKRIRAAFIAPAGHLLVSADYSQIELRIMAHLSEDATLMQVFANDLDVHAQTAAEIFAKPLAEVTKEQRRQAKAINFGLIYGMSAFGLAKQLNISRQDASRYIETYFAKFSGVKAYMAKTRELVKEHGFVSTIYGRRIYFPDIHAKSGILRAAAERAAINAPLQGSQADIIKMAMVSIDQALAQEGLQARMTMQVHDELIFEVPNAELTGLSDLVRTHMLRAATLSVPMQVNINHGKNWEEAH